MSFRLVPKSVTLSDLERRNGRYIALFQRIRVRCHRKTITSVSKSTFSERDVHVRYMLSPVRLSSVVYNVCAPYIT